MTRRTLLTLTASPLLRAADPFEDRWRAAADRVISVQPSAIGFTPSDALLMLGLMRLYQRTRYPLYADFVEGWAKHHLAQGMPPASPPSLAILLLQESRPHEIFKRYVANAVESAEGTESASFLARYGMTNREPGVVLRAARSLAVRAPASSELLLIVADVLEALEPMQPDYEPLALLAQSVRPDSTDLLSLAAAWKLVRIQVVPPARAANAVEQWERVHARNELGPIGAYLLAAAEAAAAF